MKSNSLSLFSRVLTVFLVLGMALSFSPFVKAFAQDLPTDASTESLPVATFADVPTNHWAYSFVETFYAAQMTTGCNVAPFRYCPDRLVTRAEAAVFLLRSLHGGSYQPPAASGTFADVPFVGKEWMEPWIEEFYADGFTTGCDLNPFRYCPERTVTRAELAVFTLRAKYGLAYQPPAVTASSFSDVPVAGKEWMMPWIEEFYQEGLTTGCYQSPTLQYCPERGVTRAEIATFLVRAFDIEGSNVVAQDFGVMNLSGVVGYTVGFGLEKAKVSDVDSIVVNLYNGTTLLGTNTATAKIYTDFADLTSLSAPFDVMGSFDYATDGYWTYSGWQALKNVIPSKAEIVVTFKNGLTATASNTNLTGDTSIFTKGDVVAQDFGVYIYDAVNLKGYSVGFGLVDAIASDANQVVVNLYKGSNLLGTATTTGLLTNYPTLTSLSAPFDVLGSFDYATDGNWSYSGWLGNSSDIPDKAEIIVTFKNDVEKTAVNTSLTGDTLPFNLEISDIHIASDNPIPTEAKLGDIISLTFTTNQPVTKLSNFKINGSNPDTFTNVGNVYTATHLVDGGDPITGLPATFQINVENAVGLYSQTLEATTDSSSVTIVEPIGAIDYFSGINFARTFTPDTTTIGTRTANQVVNPDGSVTISVTSGDLEYIDSGLIKSIGTLGELDTITVKGTGDFSFNLYFDVDNDGEFFLWNPDGSFAGVGSDRYALFEGPYGPILFANSTSSFGLVGGSPYVNTLAQLKAMFPADTQVGIWIGVTRGGELAGTKTATINSITVTKVP